MQKAPYNWPKTFLVMHVGYQKIDVCYFKFDLIWKVVTFAMLCDRLAHFVKLSCFCHSEIQAEIGESETSSFFDSFAVGDHFRSRHRQSFNFRRGAHANIGLQTWDCFWKSNGCGFDVEIMDSFFSHNSRWFATKFIFLKVKIIRYSCFVWIT